MKNNIQTSGSIRDEALYYISINLPIIPVCSPTHLGMSVAHMTKCKSPGKAPLLKNWQSWSVTTREDILEWFRDAKNIPINIGLPFGLPSGIIGLDIDNRQGEIILLAMSNGVIPPTWEFTTGKGRRLLFRLPSGLKTKKIKISGEGKHEEMAILTDGCHTVMPPSVHPSGTVYRWKLGCSPREINLADCPDW